MKRAGLCLFMRIPKPCVRCLTMCRRLALAMTMSTISVFGMLKFQKSMNWTIRLLKLVAGCKTSLPFSIQTILATKEKSYAWFRNTLWPVQVCRPLSNPTSSKVVRSRIFMRRFLSISTIPTQLSHRLSLCVSWWMSTIWNGQMLGMLQLKPWAIPTTPFCLKPWKNGMQSSLRMSCHGFIRLS